MCLVIALLHTVHYGEWRPSPYIEVNGNPRDSLLHYIWSLQTDLQRDREVVNAIRTVAKAKSLVWRAALELMVCPTLAAVGIAAPIGSMTKCRVHEIFFFLESVFPVFPCSQSNFMDVSLLRGGSPSDDVINTIRELGTKCAAPCSGC